MAYVGGKWTPEGPMVDPQRHLAPDERMAAIRAVCLGLSPMHPQVYANLLAEYEAAQRELRDGTVGGVCG